MPSISLIIAVYKNIAALDLIFTALDKQRFTDFEVIIAEDNKSQDMADYLSLRRQVSNFAIKHISQPDLGFQKNKALNKSVTLTASDYIVFIDGDCIPHYDFLWAHFQNKEKNTALFGRRVMLSPRLTTALYQGDKKLPLRIWTMLTYGCQKLKYAIYLPFSHSSRKDLTGIWGCNWSIYKQNLIAINGFDEDYVKPGIGEDTDIEYRLLASGVKLKRIKHKAIQYHLHHKVGYTDTLDNEQLMKEKITLGAIFCQRGLSQYL
jgi:glycosyltransferase involved in cell wall biosynthesis